ncbi:ATP-binding protein [Mesosutterella sp. AGMB02718]|uniref:ATP-binding protein n=1 Tax=Mesosutterella faecium TaxID=2925194 RepID=A0ABT7IMU9_9BURK|nr:ATP-binding protein [Mesosutterella sp. AGMB02718]MDL2059705.1 ATP-binding protein [Mesosutterella sp. AGMB02718]
MLRRFAFRNFRSYSKDAKLVLTASSRLPEAREGHALSRSGVLPAAALFGGNGSGKSNLIRALAVAVEGALGEGRFQYPVAEPSLLSGGDEAGESGFELELADPAGTRYRYGLSLDAKGVCAESLEVKESGGWELVFSRSDDALELTGLTPAAAQAALSGVIRRETMMSALSSVRDPRIRGFRNLLGGFRFVNSEEGAELPTDFGRRLRTLQARSNLANFLASFDASVTGCSVEPAKAGRKAARLLIRHGTGGSGRDLQLPVSEESAGTRRMVSLYFVLRDVLLRGGVLVADGLNAGLHPLLTREIVRLFASAQDNPRGAQLLFSTQDSSLLGFKELRRDEIWLVEKSSKGVSSLKRLVRSRSGRKPRASKLEKAYLEGRLGGTQAVKGLPVPAPQGRRPGRPNPSPEFKDSVILVDEDTFRKIARRK